MKTTISVTLSMITFIHRHKHPLMKSTASHWNLCSIITLLLTLFMTNGAIAQNYRSGIRIGWDFQKQRFMNSGAYGRLKLLSDGRQAFVCDQGGTCIIRFRNPSTSTFQSPITVATPPSGSCYTNTELIELQDGKLLYAYNERLNDSGLGTKIKVKYSTDGGHHWQNEETLYEVKEADFLPDNEGYYGIWEPAMIQLPSGEVQLFFASEYLVSGIDQQIVMLRSTQTDDAGFRLWTDTVNVSYSVGYRDGMPVPLVLQEDKGIIFAIEDDGYGGGFQPGILYSSMEDNWCSGTRYGDSSDRWIAISNGEPRGGGAPYIIQLHTGETILSTQTSAQNDLRGAPSDDMFKYRPFVYIGDATAHNFGCYSIPFPFTEEPNYGAVWNSLCQVNDSTIVCVSDVHGRTSRNGLWIVEGRIMHPMTAHAMPQATAIEDIDWASLMSDIYIGSQSQANMQVGSCWSDDSLFLHFVVHDRMIRSGSEGAPVWDTDGVEFYCDMNSYQTDNVPSGALKYLVNVDGGTLLTRMTSEGWTEVPSSQFNIRHAIQRSNTSYAIDLALPWNRLMRRPSSRRFTGYFKLHNNDLYNGREFIYHEVLSGVDEGRSRTWWQINLGEFPDGITTPRAEESHQSQTSGKGGRIYNLQGIATATPRHGIYVVDGHKEAIP